MALRGSGYPSEEAAADAGRDWRARLMAAFAAARIGADFGDRAGHGGFSDYALAAASGAEHRALNDVHGLMVFECEPAPVFLKVGPITGIVHRSQDRLRDAMAQAIRTGGLSETRQVSYDLYASSAGLPSADGRFALLMAALESMIEPVVRSEECQRHVDRLIELTESSGLPERDINSINGTLRWLRIESINRAGKELARTLDPREYMGMSAGKFFTEAYSLRSRLLHGNHPLPSWREINQWAGSLEVFVADLIAASPTQ